MALIFYGKMRRPAPLYWPGWYILRFENNESAQEASRLFKKAGMDDVLSEYTATAGYMEIPRIKRVPVSNLDSLLIPQDPRRDPFLSKVERLFRYGSFSFLYLPARRGIAVYKKILTRAGERSSGRTVFLDTESRGLFLSIILSIAGMILVCLSIPSSRSVLIMAGLPWLMFILAEGGTFGAPAILIFYTVSSLLRMERFRPIAAAIGTLVGAAGVFFIFPTLYAAATLAASVLILRLEPFFNVSILRRIRQPDHKIFQPISLANASGKQKAFPSPLRILQAMAGLGFLLPLLALPFQMSPVVPTPSPVQKKNSYTDISSLQNLFDSSNPENLPDVSGLLASAAYQEGFLYGAEYRLPNLGDTLSLKNYKEENGKLLPEKKILTRYNQSWFQSALKRELSTGVGKLYSTLPGPAPIRMVQKPPAESFLKGTSLKILIYAGIAAVFILGAFGLVFWKKPPRLDGLNFSPKRKRAA